MPDQVEVTQEDERAAHAFLDLTYGSQDDLALAFARHRQAAIQKARADADCRTCNGHGFVYCIPRDGGERRPVLCGNCLEAARPSTKPIPAQTGLVEEFRALCCSTPTIEQMGQWLSTRVDRLWAALRSPEPSEEMVEKAWREGFQAARECLADDEAFTLTEDVEEDAWRDSTARAALSSLSLPDR